MNKSWELTKPSNSKGKSTGPEAEAPGLEVQGYITTFAANLVNCAWWSLNRYLFCQLWKKEGRVCSPFIKRQWLLEILYVNDKCWLFFFSFSKLAVLRYFAIFLSCRMPKTDWKRQNKLAAIDTRYLLSPKYLHVYPIAKEQFRSTSLTRGMLEKKGNAYMT